MVKTSKRPSTSPPAVTSRLAWLSGLLRDNVVTTVLAMIVLIPLLTGTDLLNTRGKVVAFEALGTLLLVLVLSQSRLADAPARFKDTVLAGPNLPLLLFVLLALVSCAVSPFRAVATTEFLRVGFCVLLYFVLVYHLRGKGHLQTVTDGLLLVTATVSLYGLAEMSNGGGMVEGSFGSHELLGSFLMLMLPLALALGLTDRGDSKRQLASQCVALLAACCLLMARTRSAWLGAAVSLITLPLLAWRYQTVAKNTQVGTAHFFKQVQQRKHLIIGPVLILAGAVALLVLLSGTGETLGQRVGTLTRVGEDASFQARSTVWQGASHMVAARPLFGWGIGSYPVREARFTGIGDSAAQVLAHGTSHSNIAHNFYLQTAAETGLVGLGLYLAAIALFFVAGVRALGTLENGLRKAVLIGCLAAMAGQMVDAFGSPAYNFASVSLFQWVLMGLGMSAAGVGARSSVYDMSRAFGRSSASASAGVSAPLLRGFQYGVAGLVALGVASQVLPTVTSASANVTQVCQMIMKTFRTGIVGSQLLINPGESTRVDSVFGGSPVTTTYTEVYSSPGAAGLVSVTRDTFHSVKITRNSVPITAALKGSTIRVTASYVYMGKTFANTVVIQIRR